MAYNQMQELVCFHCGSYTCAVGLSDIEEICINTILHSIPCLPDCYSGLFYYKGGVIPVVRLNPEIVTLHEDADKQKNCIAVLRYPSFLFGISLVDEPFILSVGENDKTVNESGQDFSPIWKEKDIYQKNGELIFVLDIDQIVKKLTGLKVIE